VGTHLSTVTRTLFPRRSGNSFRCFASEPMLRVPSLNGMAISAISQLSSRRSSERGPYCSALPEVPPSDLLASRPTVPVIADNPWESDENARRYAQFAREHALYRQTSKDLAALACLASDACVVDLACGTGATTRAVLALLGPRGQVIAVDGAEAMLTGARSFIGDHRVRWVRSSAECLDKCGIGAVDAVVCNSAIWQTSLPATVAAVGRVLRPSGRFVFNIGAPLLADHQDADQAPAPLIQLMENLAARDHGWTASRALAGGRRQSLLSEGWIRRLLRDNGFRVEEVREFEYNQTLEDQRAWLSIPIFTLRRFAGLSYEERMALLHEAYRSLSDRHAAATTTVRWVAFAARLP
jgi:SAM-dependent methyltransferase